MSKVKLKNGVAWTQEGSARKTVTEIDVPVGNDCCKLDCCKKAIVFVDDDGNVVEILLSDLYDLLNPPE